MPLVLFCFGAVGSLLYAKLHAVNIASKENQTISWPQERRKWRLELDKADPTLVYRSFKDDYEKIDDPQVRHAAAHLFGELLYEVLVLGAVSVCDSSFESGCYHGVFTKTLSGYGEEGIRMFFDTCERLPSPRSGCVHSIGHGLVQLYGRDQIEKALMRCEALGWEGTPFGCVGGVFMEYMFPTLFDGVGIDNQLSSVFAIPNVDEFCPSLPQMFQDSCYFQIIQGVRDMTQNASDALAAYCEEIALEAHKQTCYFSIGATSIAVDRLSPSDVHVYCEALDSEFGAIWCHAGASFAYVLAQDKAAATAVCELIDDAAACITHAKRYDTNVISPL